NFQKYKELINENVDRKIIRYIVFQYEYTKTRKKHIQGFCILWTQLRLRNYKYSKKASTIKSIFQDEEMYVDYHNRIFEDMIRYCKKDRNRCSKHYPYCRCNFFDLTKICDKCDEKLPTNNNTEGFNQYIEEQKKIHKQTIEDIKEQIKPINKIVIDAFVNSGIALHIIKELYNTIRDSQKKSFKRCFTPCNIYIYGDSRTGKDYLTQILFSNTYHKSQNDEKWFERYDENKVFVFDDFYNHNMEFSTLLTLIDNKPHTVQKKSGHLNFCLFVNIFTSNTSLQNQYVYFEDAPYFGNETVKIENKRKYSSIYNRFDYIIEYKKFRNDDIRPCVFEYLCCSVKRIFQKGSYEDFVNLRFDIEFNSDVTLEQIAYIIRNHNSLEDSKGIRYYNHNFNSQIDKFELIDHRIENDKHVNMIIYPEVRRKLENSLHRTKRKKIQFKGYVENKLDYVIEDLNNDEKYDSDVSISSLSSNNSEITKHRKKRKAVL
ncbi:12213_t:CDS:2, partial [Racocetra persica]